MLLSEKFTVSSELALLYDFVNSLDRRHYVERGVPHTGGDELATIAQFRHWLQVHGVRAGATTKDFEQAVELRQAIRAFLKLPVDKRRRGSKAAEPFSRAAEQFPLIVQIASGGTLTLGAHDDAQGLACVLAQLYRLSVTGELDRLKMCASDECQWIFFDRSKPSNRRWCSSALCGNRQKTRAYRKRQG